MSTSTDPSSPQQIGYKKVASRIYSVCGNDLAVGELDSIRGYLVNRIFQQVQAESDVVLARVLRLVEGDSAAIPPQPAKSRNYMLGLVSLRLESASWDTLAIVGETLQDKSGQAETPAPPARNRLALSSITDCVARVRRAARAAIRLPLWTLVKIAVLEHLVIPVLGFTLAVTVWALSFLLWIVMRRPNPKRVSGAAAQVRAGLRSAPRGLNPSTIRRAVHRMVFRSRVQSILANIGDNGHTPDSTLKR